MSKTRGFKKLVGAKITSVDTTCVNHVLLFSGDDEYFAIDAVLRDGIPVIELMKYKVRKIKLNSPARPKRKKD